MQRSSMPSGKESFLKGLQEMGGGIVAPHQIDADQEFTLHSSRSIPSRNVRKKDKCGGEAGFSAVRASGKVFRFFRMMGTARIFLRV